MWKNKRSRIKVFPLTDQLSMRDSASAILFRSKLFLRYVLGDRVWSYYLQLSPRAKHRIARLCLRETKGVVLHGPFAGLRYGSDLDTSSGGLVPKLLGTYEKELHPILSLLQSKQIAFLINIGSADGYYAVGLARNLPRLSVIAFELTQRGRLMTQSMGLRNGVNERIDVRGGCDPAALSSALEGVEPRRTLVLCDVEGYEDVLLDPALVKSLRECWLLVEVHDAKVPGVSRRLQSRFDETHRIDTIWQERRTVDDWPAGTETARLADEDLEVAISEGRPVRDGETPMCWFYMIPRVAEEA